MPLHIVTADEAAGRGQQQDDDGHRGGPAGVGKTYLLTTVSPIATLCLDFEAGLKSVQDWSGESIPIRTFPDALDIACLIGGINPAASPEQPFSEAHYRHVSQRYPELVQMVATKRLIFVDSITDLTRQAMDWAKTRPEAFSEKTGKPDTRGAYGCSPARSRIAQDCQHAPGKAVIFVGILEASPTSSTGPRGSRSSRAARTPANCWHRRPGLHTILFTPEGDAGARPRPGRGPPAGLPRRQPLRRRQGSVRRHELPSRPTSAPSSPRSTLPTKEAEP